MLGYMFWAGGCQGNGTGCHFLPRLVRAEWELAQRR